jgi:hypothetical protein
VLLFSRIERFHIAFTQGRRIHMRGIKVAAATLSLSAALGGTAAIGLALPAGAAPRSPCTQGSYPPAQSTVALSRSRADVGMRMSYEARCFKPNERVRATVFSKPVVVDTERANRNGAVDGSFRVPNVPAGRHTLELRGLESGTIQTATFVVRDGRGNGNGNGNNRSDDSSLAFTGSDFGTTAGLGALLLAGGGALVIAAKRRKHVNAAA